MTLVIIIAANIKDFFFKWTPIERSLKSLEVKLLIDNVFIERLDLSVVTQVCLNFMSV